MDFNGGSCEPGEGRGERGEGRREGEEIGQRKTKKAATENWLGNYYMERERQTRVEEGSDGGEGGLGGGREGVKLV